MRCWHTDLLVVGEVTLARMVKLLLTVRRLANTWRVRNMKRGGGYTELRRALSAILPAITHTHTHTERHTKLSSLNKVSMNTDITQTLKSMQEAQTAKSLLKSPQLLSQLSK